MKTKLTLLIALLAFCVSGLWATATPATSITSGHYYSIQLPTKPYSINASNFKTNYHCSYFQIVSSGLEGHTNGYYIKSGGQYVYPLTTGNEDKNNESTILATRATAYEWLIESASDGGVTYFKFRPYTGNTDKNYLTAWSADVNQYLVSWSYKANQSRWILHDISATPDLPKYAVIQHGLKNGYYINSSTSKITTQKEVFEFVPTANAAGFYIKSGSKYLKAKTTGKGSNDDSHLAIEQSDDAFEWKIEPALYYNSKHYYFIRPYSAASTENYVTAWDKTESRVVPYTMMLYAGNEERFLSYWIIDEPTVGAFYRIKDKDNKYVYATGTDAVLSVSSSVTNPMSSVFYTESGSTIKFVSYLNGHYLYNKASVGATVHKDPQQWYSYTFDHYSGHPAGSFRVKNGSNYWSSTGSIVSFTSSFPNDEKTAFYFEEVTSLPVTLTPIGGHGFASFYTPVAISSLPEGVKAYIATIDKSASRIRFTSIDNIPANTAVILYKSTCTENTTIDLPIGSASSSTTGNKLSGNVATVALGSQNVMTMQIVNENLGFYKYTGSNLNGFKAYVNIGDIPSEVKSFVFDFDDDDATGIASLLEKAGEETAIYNLAGQRLNKMQKGINIVNGKKVLK